MHTNQELVKLLSNHKKRTAFIQDFKSWGVWFTQPELNLTYYKYDLSDGSRLIVMEYLRKPYPGEKTADGSTAIVCHNRYLQIGAYFNPFAASAYAITDHLKNLKEKLAKELRENARADSEQQA